MDLRTGHGVREHRISFLSRAWTATTAARQDEQRCARGPALEPGVDWTIYLLSAWEFGVAKEGVGWKRDKDGTGLSLGGPRRYEKC